MRSVVLDLCGNQLVNRKSVLALDMVQKAKGMVLGEGRVAVSCLLDLIDPSLDKIVTLTEQMLAHCEHPQEIEFAILTKEDTRDALDTEALRSTMPCFKNRSND